MGFRGSYKMTALGPVWICPMTDLIGVNVTMVTVESKNVPVFQNFGVQTEFSEKNYCSKSVKLVFTPSRALK